eukprot:CAMPEP_0168179526 /NCGR_PEP_ID=MMETSP0139_2-20121125/9907_1 /TAXON_ID=44445 /ORGANISM="Pseudo-nitzschia australis, Strain 10249 10 AB" /LENGTH=658 /DNA_ID=CAMNT_0008099395 /DNA_START=345 /DNA_END=2321 /DNA_ORIENTATION=-
MNLSVHSAASTGTASNNPITNDVQLNILVHDKLNKITKYKSFHRWKSKFLNRFENYLTQSGRTPAKEASDKLQEHLNSCSKRANVLLGYIDKGDLSPVTGKKSVRAALALNEFCRDLENTRVELGELVPAKQVDERRRRYTKFHIGASLIEEGFPQYVSMKELEEKVQEIADKTRDVENDEDVLDKLQRDLFRYYAKQVTRFCDVMADLDLYEIMLKCVQFLHPPEDEESDDEELTIFVRRYECIAGDGVGNSVTPSDNGNNNNNENTGGGGGASLFRPRKSAAAELNTQNNLLPQKKTIKVEVEENESIVTVATLAAEELGFQLQPDDVTKIMNQVKVRYKDDSKEVEKDQTSTLQELGIENGDVLTIEQTMIPIQVRRTTPSGETILLDVVVDTNASLRELKDLLEEAQNNHEDLESIPAKDQKLFFNGNEFDDDDNGKSCADLGIVLGSVLDLESKIVPVVDPMDAEKEKIVIVDTKYGTMFSVDRQTAIEKAVLSQKVVNCDDEFLEATAKDIDKTRMQKSMMSSPNLKVKPQLVIAKMKIEDYELEEAEKVQNMWGINLKKTNTKKRETEIFFVDLKTDAVGFLNRTKLMDMNFITVVKVNDPSVLGDNKKAQEVEETLEQAETDQQKYDFFVTRIREIFGIAYGESLGLSQD